MIYIGHICSISLVVLNTLYLNLNSEQSEKCINFTKKKLFDALLSCSQFVSVCSNNRYFILTHFPVFSIVFLNAKKND